MESPAAPPPLPGAGSTPARSILAAFLSLVLVLFLAAGVISFFGNLLMLLFQRQDLMMADAILSLLLLLMGFATCGLMALTRGMPKRLVLPVVLFLPVVCIGILPLLVCFKDQAVGIFLGVSVLQIGIGLWVICQLQGGLKFRWPLFPEGQLGELGFGWRNFCGVTCGMFALALGLLAFTAFSARLALGRFTEGFVSLGTSGLTMQVRNYIRDDGKRITLVPMSHIGELDFYQDIAASFSPESVILMEGVTDHRNLATAHSDYSKMAAAVGGVEQTKVFKPRGEIVAADVDMSSFSPATLDLLKGAMLIHSKGVTAETLPILMKPTPPGLERQLMDDILTKRNRHLLGVLHERLPGAEHIIIPWGAAHMPEIAREIVKSGFRVVDTKDYLAIRFGW